jgi:hypothetical protein
MRKLLQFILVLVSCVPGWSAAIGLAFVVTLHLTGNEASDASWTTALVFLLMVPFGIMLGGLVNYGIVLALLRLAGKDHWLDFPEPKLEAEPRRFDAVSTAFERVDSAVRRAIPSRRK